MGGGFLIPLHCFLFILFYSQPTRIKKANTMFSVWILLLLGLQIKLHCLFKIYWYPMSQLIHLADVVTCDVLIFFSCIFIPLHGFLIISVHPEPVFKKESNMKLRKAIPFSGGL